MIRHSDADMRPVTIERSDAIDAAAGLALLAKQARTMARARRYSGPEWGITRGLWRRQAEVYDAAALRLQAAADAALSAPGVRTGRWSDNGSDWADR